MASSRCCLCHDLCHVTEDFVHLFILISMHALIITIVLTPRPMKLYLSR